MTELAYPAMCKQNPSREESVEPLETTADLTASVSRRQFLKTLSAGSTVLLVGFHSNGVLASEVIDTTSSSLAPEALLNPFVQIDQDGVLTVIIKHFEMGQGTTTGLTTLVAEELDANWDTTRTSFAPSDVQKYKNLFFGAQGTGGSTAIANSFMQYRKAGAAAKALIKTAAAQQWQIDESAISVENGRVKAGDRSGHFGEFIQRAATLTPPAEPNLKSPSDFKLIGKAHIRRKDGDEKINGQATFAMDIVKPGMVYAVLIRSPKFGGRLTTYNLDPAQKINGFIKAEPLPNDAGLVIFGKDTWAALQAKRVITANWDFSAAEIRSTEELVEYHQSSAESADILATKNVSIRQAQSAMKDAEKTIEAEFIFPFLAHAPMEPLNCVIAPKEEGEGVVVYDGCQFPSLAHGAMASVLELDPSLVDIQTVYAGGSFGRRATPTADYHVEAAFAYRLYGSDTPVKLMWDREDDIRGGYYRPMAVHKVSIGLDEDKKIKGWSHKVASKSIIIGSPFEGVMVHDGVDHTTVEGLADTLYRIPSMAIAVNNIQSAIPVLWWRAVGHTHTAFVMESLMDMLAYHTLQDPIDLRLSLLDESDAKQQRFANVMREVRELSGWKSGQRRGFAAHFSFNTYVAVVADISVVNKKIKVDNLWIAVDCGIAVNPDVIVAQMEGGAGYALSAILHNKITFNEGEVVESNFPQYAPLRMNEMPEVKVKVVQSALAPTGVGEPATPPTGPAVANAVFAVTGKRVMRLPLDDIEFG